MSKRNGDRARAQREQKKKLLRRKHSLELRKRLESESTEAVTKLGEAETKTAQAD